VAVSHTQHGATVVTTQTVVFDGVPTGLTLSAKAFDVDDPDTEVASNTFGIVEGTNAKSRYVVTITRATALPAGDYDVRLFVGSVPIAVGRFRFAGTDGEAAPEVPQAAELDSATLQKIDDILEDTGTTLPGLIGDIEGGGGGGSATLENQEAILAALQGVEAIQVASPNVQGNLVLTQGDDYDGVANPRAQWNVTTDYTTGWTVRLTIRDADDAVVYTNTGSVVSATVVAVTIAAPTGLTMTGCPGQWQGKFDVELTHSSGKKKTIALGVCYINEDQTR